LQRYSNSPDLHSFPHDALPISTVSFELVEMKKEEIVKTPTKYKAPWKDMQEEGRIKKALQGFLDNKDQARLAATSRTAHRLFQRSEEHTSELQSRENLVCRLLL